MPASDQSPSSSSSRPHSPPPMCVLDSRESRVMSCDHGHRLPVKRKASQGPDSQQDLDSVPSSSKDFESGRVTCEDCGESVSYRDERSGAFTTKHWDTHKLGCPAHSSAPPALEPAQTRPKPSGPSPESISAGPPSKRRRAKRSEEERIQYLRSDPYVAQFEPYRVRCASCDKWIRLRPNSTYCSIPWDAHRKSCLARNATKDPARSYVAADTEVRKKDGERVLCKACNTWISVGSEGQAAQAWSQHRAQCKEASPAAAAPPPPAPVASAATAPALPSVPPPPQHQLALVSALPPPAARAVKDKDNDVEMEIAKDGPPSPSASSPLPPLSASAPHLSDTASSAPGPSAGTGSESRRRNAEQRAAHLRADPLLAHVEPHRVFCALCRKWVQLRQDSSFCAYPWQQHRSKCVIRHAKKTKTPVADSVTHSGPASPDSGEESTDNGELGTECRKSDTAPTLTATAMTATTTEDPDAGPDAVHPAPRFAGLDSPADRLSFTRHAIAYLFRTTYTPADALTIAALVAYMNAALPPDRHEEFDTAEVTRAAKTLHDRGRVAFEGDTLKLLHR
ncbi:hypothetical protein EI94DRAFT_1095948 [Lactarius quietus]|nr:hypothetical protein EI94DRAFT_1095948 [Lactarius quietus]